jgi:hypothetical protein
MRYLLCWLPHTDIHKLKPVSTVDDMLERANLGDPDSLANMVRFNWMVQDLRRNPMLKPIFCEDDYRVIVGDTRVAAAKLVGITHVPVMAYLTEPQGTICRSINDIKILSGFQTDAYVSWTPWTIDPVTAVPDWIDIGDQRTARHGHDESRRLAAMQDHLKKNPRPLTREWLLEPKDWGDIFN